MTISIIIPTYNESKYIGKLLNYLLLNMDESVVDLIVCEGGSSDDTVHLAKHAGANVVLSPHKGRSAQMNFGAGFVRGEVLYFVHADCFPPPDFIRDIHQALQDGFDLGRYRTKFDSEKFILKINAWGTRFDYFFCMGGDQTLFVKRSLFESCNGFKENMKIMEEYDFCERARKLGKYKILNDTALISARKYDTNSWLKIQLANFIIIRMYNKGASQNEMFDTYRQMLNP